MNTNSKKPWDTIKYVPKVIFDSIEMVLTTEGNPALYHYYEEDHIWIMVKKSLNDIDFMKLIIFNNDYLGIAPVHSFCAYNCEVEKLTSFEKNSIGRFFKFAFRVLGYSNSKRVYKKWLPIQYAQVFLKKE